MKTIMIVLSMALMLMLSALALASDVVPIPNEEYIKLLIESLGGLKGATALGIAGIVVKVLLATFNSELLGKQMDKLTGKYKLLLVTLLSLVGGIVALVSTGMPVLTALVHSSILPMFAVFVNQVYKQFVEKDD